jgi:hypothetical protein
MFSHFCGTKKSATKKEFAKGSTNATKHKPFGRFGNQFGSALFLFFNLFLSLQLFL